MVKNVHRFVIGVRYNEKGVPLRLRGGSGENYTLIYWNCDSFFAFPGYALQYRASSQNRSIIAAWHFLNIENHCTYSLFPLHINWDLLKSEKVA